MRRRSKAMIVVGIALVLGGGSYFAATRTIDRLLRTENFLCFISHKTAVKLGTSECGYLPVAWRGMSIYSAGILARGQTPHQLTELSTTYLHAICSLETLLSS